MMSASFYPAPTACVEPGLGTEATQALGRASSMRGATHLEICPACRLQRIVFAALDASACPLPSELGVQVHQLALGRLRAGERWSS